MWVGVLCVFASSFFGGTGGLFASLCLKTG